MGSRAGEVLSMRHPGGIDSFDTNAVEDGGCYSQRRMMRSGKAEDAMRATGMIGIAGRQFRYGLAVMQTELQGRCTLGSVRGE